MKQILWILRFLMFYIGLIPVTIIIACFGWLCAPLPALWCYRIITSWSHFFIWWVRITCGLNYKVTGRRNLPKAPFVALCNHQSTWETIFMQVLLPPQSSVLKTQLLYIPFFGWGLALIKPIAVSRNSIKDIKVILSKGIERLREGRCVIFYPEGTRLQTGKHKRYSRTGAALAVAAKVPVVPIAHNAGNFWPRGLWIKRSDTIKICIGKAIRSDNASELTTLTETWINHQKSLLIPPG